MKKRMAAVLAAVILLLSLAGCGEPGHVRTPGRTELRWAVWDVDETQTYQILVREFERRNPNVDIQIVDLGSNNYANTVRETLKNDASLDIVTIKNMTNYVDLITGGYLDPLQGRIAQAGVEKQQFGGLMEQVTSDDGMCYMMPYLRHFWVLFYNKEVFDKAGEAYPTNRMTYSEYDAMARRITSGIGNQKTYGTYYVPWRESVQIFSALDAGGAFGNFACARMQPYYEMALQQQKDGICPNFAVLQTKNIAYQNAFENGSAAMMPMGTWFINTLVGDQKKSGKSVPKWGVARLPIPETGAAGRVIGSCTGLSIAAKSAHKDLAWDFLRFATTDDDTAMLLASAGGIPARRSAQAIDCLVRMPGFPKDETSRAAMINPKTFFIDLPMQKDAMQVDQILSEGHLAIMEGAEGLGKELSDMEADLADLHRGKAEKA